MLFQYALLRIRDRDQAEDLVQETLLAALRSRDGFRGNASERTWLVAILRNKIFDHLRKRYRDPSISMELEDAFEQAAFEDGVHWTDKPTVWRHPRQALQDKEFWSVFQECADALPQNLGDALRLRTIDELSTQEICKILNVTKTNLGVLLYRARLRLRKCLELKWFSGGRPKKRT